MAGSTDPVLIRCAGWWAALQLAWLAVPCAAQQPAALSAQDVAVLAATCATCHGPGGRPPADSPGSIPSLRGQGSAALLARMQAFKDGAVPGATVMPLLMQGYGADQLQALARWFGDPATATEGGP